MQMAGNFLCKYVNDACRHQVESWQIYKLRTQLMYITYMFLIFKCYEWIMSQELVVIVPSSAL